MDHLKKILYRARQLQSNTPSNCLGTMVYLIGASHEDTYVDPPYFLDYQPYLKQISRPRTPCIITFVDEQTRIPAHSGIVTGTNPLLVTSRTDYQGPVEISEPIRVHGKLVTDSSLCFVLHFCFGISMAFYKIPEEPELEVLSWMVRRDLGHVDLERMSSLRPEAMPF